MMINKIFSFFAGAICGALVGGVAALLLAPNSGESLRADALARWEAAVAEARQAKANTQQELEAKFEQLSQG